MASITTLWKARAKFPIGTLPFFRAWAKRLITLRELITRNRSRRKWMSRGASIHQTAEIGEATAEGKMNLLSIGSLSFLGKIQISLHTTVKIGSHVCINDGVKILTGSHDVMDPLWRNISAPIIIEDYSWIGTGAMILPGVTIGKGAVVGAGSVVAKSVPPYAIVVGNPARPTPKSRCENLIYNPCEFLAANRAWLIG